MTLIVFFKHVCNTEIPLISPFFNFPIQNLFANSLYFISFWAQTVS